jgi:hypothetical protein
VSLLLTDDMQMRRFVHVVEDDGAITCCKVPTLPRYERLGNRLWMFSYLRDIRPE